jgi:ribosomal protein L37AE/L43A
MPAPMKPCDGSFSDETIRSLIANVDRAQWLLHACTRCGQQVGARLDKGRWTPDMHWPTVPRRSSANKTPAIRIDERVGRIK